ncbi:MAG: 4-hydroxy-tetrahydrodipicolinate reductase [Deltaproteobacteria bacterium]|nr:4-hydroxy-tetrahydrodipicolinate reductase [Deltaproteobacteria bacterium]
MIRLIVCGAAGRMGRQIITNLCQDPDLKLVGAIESPSNEALGKDACLLAGCCSCGVMITDSLQELAGKGEAIISFSTPSGSLEHLQAAARAKKPIVIGTTGFSEDVRGEIKKLSRTIPIVLAPNMSTGVNTLWKIVEEAARVFGKGFSVQMKEVHHVHKKDAPSGTALRTAEVIATASGRELSDIPIESVREGEVVGDHTILFSGPGESLEITHHASSRETFSIGALRAAKWLIGKKPGLYDMQQVLGLKP